jgi:hypothetical protein
MLHLVHTSDAASVSATPAPRPVRLAVAAPPTYRRAQLPECPGWTVEVRPGEVRIYAGQTRDGRDRLWGSHTTDAIVGAADRGSELWIDRGAGQVLTWPQCVAIVAFVRAGAV